MPTTRTDTVTNRCRYPRTSQRFRSMVSTLVWSRPEPEHGNTTFNRLEGRNPPCHTGFRQSGRTGIGTEPGISHLYFFEQDTRRGSYQLRPERGRWLDARFRNSGEYGFGPRKVDVDQLPEYADRRKRHSGTV